MVYQTEEELRKELVQPSRNFTTTDVKPLSQKLVEMGFDRDTFMVAKFDVKVGERIEDNGTVTPNPYLSFGPEHRGPNGNGRTNGELDDEYIGAAIGGIGANNGLYSAMTKYGNQIIITKDPEIYRALSSLGFKDGLGVPMSNGGVIQDPKLRESFESMKWACARKADREGQEKRTAAVQRSTPNGDIITTYDPNDISNSGCYRNIRHYEKTPEGNLRSISVYEASEKLKLNTQYAANTQQSMGGNKLDGAETNKMIASSWIDYSKRSR